MQQSSTAVMQLRCGQVDLMEDYKRVPMSAPKK